MFIDKPGNQRLLRLKKNWDKIDLTGYRVGMIEYRRRARKKKDLWWAQCICGTEVLVQPPYRALGGTVAKMHCGCFGGLLEDFSSFPEKGYIDLPQFTETDLRFLYDLWTELIVKPIKKPGKDVWLFRNGINHCSQEWCSFYNFISILWRSFSSQ